MKKELINLGLCKTIEIANQNPLTKTDIDYLKIGFTEGIKWAESAYTSIETIEDACTIVGYNDDNVALYHKCKYSDDITLPKKLFAILQLTIICKALNIFEKLVNNSYWRPIFIYSDNDLIFMNSIKYYLHNTVILKNEINLHTEELANYCAEQFIDLWKILYKE